MRPGGVAHRVARAAGTSPPPRALFAALPGRIGTLLTDLRSRCTGASPIRCVQGVPGRGGFSLLEVLVALAILGIGLGVIFDGFVQGLRVRGAAAESVRMALVAERIIGGLPEREQAPAEVEEGEESGCRWRLEVVGGTGGATVAAGAGATEPAVPVSLVEVRLTVTGPSGGSWVMTTLLPETDE